MALTIVPFTDMQLEEAARLLAARHRAHRAEEPELPAQLEDPAAAAAVLKRALLPDHAQRMVAQEDERMAGFLIGTAGPLAATVPFEGMAVDPASGGDIYRELYAAAAGRWAEAGCRTHYVSVMTSDAAAVEAWFSLGFGQETVTGVRDTDSLAADAPGGIEIRRGEPGDLDAVVRLEDGFRSYQAGSPAFIPYGPPRRAAMPAPHERLMADPANAYWLALRQGRAVAYQLFAPVPYGIAHLPESCVYIEHTYTEEAERGSGIGTALLQRGLAWAREGGYERCAADWIAPNVLSGRFWRRNGFRPTSYRLCRRVWGEGRSACPPSHVASLTLLARGCHSLTPAPLPTVGEGSSCERDEMDDNGRASA